LKDATCHHCGLDIPEALDISIEEKGQTLRFCCRGCEGAYRIISGAGLKEFYQRREWQTPGLPEGAYSARYDDAALTPYIETLGDNCSITFLIEGLRCATCIWLNERILSEIPGVIEARLNYGTHRARVIYNPLETTPAKLFMAVSELGYDPRPYTRASIAESRKKEWHSLLIRFGTAFFLSMQLMGYSLALYAGFFQGIDPQTRQIIQYFAAVVTTPVVFYAGWPFLRGALRSLRNKAPDMDLLIALGVLAAYGTSLYALVNGGEVYFDTAAMIVTFLLAGRLFETSAKNRAAGGIDRLMQLAPDTAQRVTAEGVETVAATQLQVGEIVQVLPGDRFPVDGVIITGESDIDMSAATGEPLPVTLGPQTSVLSGTLNLTAPLQVKVTTRSADSFIARVARLVEEAQARKAPVQRLADRIAAIFVPLVLVLAAATAIYWWLGSGENDAPLLTAVAVLVVACPCALGLATPTAILVASGKAAAHGILFRGGDTLELAGRCTLVAFDKTGTLTTGSPRVVGFDSPTLSENQLLQFMGTLEQGSRHPLAQGILQATESSQLALGPMPAVETFPGLGLKTGSGENRLIIGNARFMHQHDIELPTLTNHPGTPVHLAKGADWLGSVFLEDTPRDEAVTTIVRLKTLGLKTHLLTGDLVVRARQVASALSIEDLDGEMTPAEKASRIQDFQNKGEVVLMAGDGINDAPALTVADIGCAMSGGTDIALDSSDLVLTRADLRQLVTAILLARQTLRIIRQNLFWAFFYNIVALPLAASGMLLPIHAAAAMALSSICVVANSLRLKRFTQRSA